MQTATLTLYTTPGTPATTVVVAEDWTSSNEDIATVSNGIVTGITAGTATITAYYEGATATCTVTVAAAKTTITLNPTSLSFSNTASASKRITATVKQGDKDITASSTIVWSSENSSIATVDADGYVTPKASGTTTIRATLKDDNTVYAFCRVTVSNPLRISASNTKLTSSNSTSVLYVYFNDKLVNGSDISWKYDTRYVRVSDNNSNSNSSATVTPIANTGSSGVTITAQYRDVQGGPLYEASVTIVVSYSAYNVATATVYTSTDSYNLDDRDDANGSSIISQLDSYFNSSSSRYYGVESVEFSDTTNTYGNLSASSGRTYYVDGRGTSSSYDLSDVYFTPKKVGTAIFTLTANVYDSTSYRYTTPINCTISFKVEEGTASGGDVVYTAAIGETVYFDSSDFEDFWDDNFSRGTLESVSFKVSGGTLRDSDGKTVGTKDCYVSPRSSQIDLDGVYFEPNSTTSKKAGTVKFSFTATGYSRNSSRATTKNGTVSIIYTGDAKDINYSVNSNGTVNLKASDFTAACKEATGSSAPSGMTIQFQSVPRNGTLTYTDSSKKNSSTITLTSSNIKNRNFTTRSSGSNQIGDVTYKGTSGTDTIEYIAYSGSTPLFGGKIVFNGTAAAPTNLSVTFTSTGGAPAVFRLADFNNNNSTVMGKTYRIRFTAPSNGSLLLNGTSSAVGVDIYPSNLGTVSYRPKAGFGVTSGTDKCLFTCFDSAGNLVGSGTVNLVVAGNTATTPTTPTTPGASSISQFKDVSATAWYRTELADLVSKGIIKGKSATSFAPRDNVTYGEALKMVLRAVGYTAEEPAGSNWAINYKTIAVNNKWISNDVVLNNAITRSAMADLVAKALNIGSSTAANPFADTANGYAVALYNTTPKIFNGEAGADGKMYFHGSDTLKREQICAVIYRVNQYYTNNNSNQMPDGI